MKIKRKTFVGGILATLCTCTALTFGAVFTSSATTANAISSSDLTTGKLVVPELTLTGYNSSTGKVFDGDSLSQLYDAILGTKYEGKGTLSRVKETLKDSSGSYNYTLTGFKADNTPQTVILPNARTAADIYADNDNRDVYVNFGGIEWEVTYVTLDNNNNVIVDLWQATSTDTSNFAGGTGYTHFLTTSHSNISSIYGTSYIRSQTLNAGSLYYTYNKNEQTTAGTAETNHPQSATNTYAPFTMTNSALAGSGNANKSLTDYIVKPTDVKYQEVESWPGDQGLTSAGLSYANPGTTWNYVNEAYGVPYAENYYTYCRTTASATPVASSSSSSMVNTWYGGSSGTNATGTACNHKTGYADWQNDYIWLPSITETGSSTSRAGMWGLSASQRANNKAAVPSGSLSGSTTTTTAVAWTRTGYYINTSKLYALNSSGATSGVDANAKVAVRPALHLNLTAAQAAADYETVNIPQSGSITYNAKDYIKLSDVLAQVKTEVQTANPSAADPTLWYEEAFHKLDVGTASGQYLSSNGAVEYKVEYTQQGKTTAESPQTSFKIRDAGTYKITCKLTDPTKYRWRDPSSGTVDSNGAAEKTFTITVKQAELKYQWKNDSSMTGTAWSKDFDKAFIDGNAATANAPWVYLDYTLLSGDTAKNTDTSGGAGGTIADDKYPYIVLKYVEKVNTYGDAAITVDNVRTSIAGTKGSNYPKEAQTYTVTFEDKNKDTGNYKLVADTGVSASRDYTINKKKITAPAKLAALSYTGKEQSFTVAQYDGDYMEYGTLAGTTFTAAAAPTDMTVDTTSGLVLKATKVGKYKVAFRPIVSKDSSGNDVIRNYEWQTNATGSNVYEVEYEIKPKALEFDFTSSADNGSFTIKTDTTGKVTVSYKTGKGPIEDDSGVAEAVETEIFVYYNSDGDATAVVNPGTTWNEISFADLKDKTGTHTTGDYTIGVRLKSGVAANANYTIDTNAAATYTKGITINAGEASIDDMKLSFKDSTMGANDHLQGLPVTDTTAGTKNLQFAIDANGDPVAYFPQLDFDGTIFEIDGTPTYTYADGSTPSFAGGLTKAGKVTVTVNIKIKASEQATNKMPASYTGNKFASYVKTSDTEATVTFEYTIDKMEIDTSVFKLQYSYDKINWKNFATADNKVEYAKQTIYVRIDPTSLVPVSAGVSVKFAGKDYAEGKNKGTYTAGANFTLTDSDNFTIKDDSYAWEITNKQINVTNWVPGDFNIGGVDYIGEIMVINGHKDLYDSGVIEYVYAWSDMEGNSGSGTGDDELAKIFAVASPTNQVTVTATVQLKAGMSSTYDLVGTSFTSQAFHVGAAKETATISNAGSAEYGSVNESAFGVKVEADGENLPAINALTQALLYEVYLHDYDGLSVDNISGDGYGLLSGVDYSKLNAGKYVIEVRFTAAGAQDYAPKGARQLFEIMPKKIAVPQVTKDVVYNGDYINLADYLDGNYNADIMSMLSGYTNKTAGSYTVTFKLNSTNYMWVEPTSAEPMSKLFAKAVPFADGITIDNSALTATLSWTINKIVLSTDGWNLKSKEGASLNALSAYQQMIEDNGLDISIGYRYYDTNGNLIEEPVLKGGDKYIVEAYLTGEDAANFEFADGTDETKSVSARKEYTVPQSAAAAFLGSALGFAKANWLWLVIAAAALLFLIILICIIAGAKKRKRKREEIAEQRRLEKEEREKQEREERRREEREERRMDRMSQQQMMMPQMMPQMMGGQMPMQQAGGQSTSNGGGNADGAQLAQMQAELAAVKAEQAAMRAEQNAVLRSDMNALRNDYMFDRTGGRGAMPAGMTTETLVEIITAAVKSALAGDTKPAAQKSAEPKEEPAKEAAMPVCPPDAVMTTVTTTKIDTTKKQAQPAQAQAAPSGRTVVRNLVAPMPVDDGRVFDVGGFYKPADPVTDMGFTDDTDKN